MYNKFIPFNMPVGKYFTPGKIKHLKKFSGSSNSKYSRKCSQWLTKNLKCQEAILVNSCTAALEMSAILINTRPGDEIIMPSYTFVSTANAFRLRGAKIIFVDIDKKTMNISVEKIEKAITKKTKAVVIVHYAGISCDLKKIIKLKKKYKFFLIEDAAQSIMSKYNNKFLGTFGDMATLSFHETKNIHCGEGGALLINNKKFVKRAHIIKDKGTNRLEFDKKLINKYEWVDLGSSYGLNEINCLILYSLLKKCKKINYYRKKFFYYYHQKLKNLEKKKFINRIFVPKYAKFNAHIYYIHVNPSIRDKLIKFMQVNKIGCTFHYVPLHLSPFGSKVGKCIGKMNNTINCSKSIIRLPLYLDLKISHINKVIKYLNIFFKKNEKKAQI